VWLGDRRVERPFELCASPVDCERRSGVQSDGPKGTPREPRDLPFSKQRQEQEKIGTLGRDVRLRTLAEAGLRTRTEVAFPQDRRDDRSVPRNAASLSLDEEARLPGVEREAKHPPTEGGHVLTVQGAQARQELFGGARGRLRGRLEPG
jgi:hypothetical protein